MPQLPGWKAPTVAWADAAEWARDRIDDLRRRVDHFNLATKSDVEMQSRLGRDRVSVVLKEFLEAQRSHDEALRETLRSEVREELQSFASALGDGVLALEEPFSSFEPRPPRRRHVDVDDVDYLDDDEFDDEVDLIDRHTRDY